MTEKKKVPLKKAIGNRLGKFRAAINKSPEDLAKEMVVNPTEIKNIESGDTYPQHDYLDYWRDHYDLNLNWLFTGKGAMFYDIDEPDRKRIMPLWDRVLDEAGPDIGNILQMIQLMRVPLTRQILKAKLTELRVVGREAYAEYFKDRDKVGIELDEWK